MSREILQHLARRIREIEAGGQSPVMPAATIPALEAVLPDGLPGGALVEVLCEAEGSGAWTLAMLMARRVLASASHGEPSLMAEQNPRGPNEIAVKNEERGMRNEEVADFPIPDSSFLVPHSSVQSTCVGAVHPERPARVLVVADHRRCFYPPAAARLGIDLQRTLILRGLRPEGLLSALVQALRCPAVGATIGSFARLHAAQYRSLQLAAEAGGGVGFLCLPASARGAPSFAAVRLFVTPIASGHASRRIQVEVVRLRGGKAGRSFLLEIDHETGDVRLLPVLAPAAFAACSA